MTENANDTTSVPAQPPPFTSDATKLASDSTRSPPQSSDSATPVTNTLTDDAVFKRPPKSEDQNGEAAPLSAKEPNDSEAETDILSDPEITDSKKSDSKIKSERSEAADNEREKGPERAHTFDHVKSSGRISPPEDSRDGVKRVVGERRRRKSSGAASTSASWTSSAHSKHDPRHSPADAAPSPPQTAHSPSFPNGARSRSQSIAESRKRKTRDDSSTKASEPPRQRHKTDGPGAQRQPFSPTAASSRQHKRSASTQSALPTGPGRKRRDTNNLALQTHDQGESHSEFSSEEGSSPRRQQKPRSQHSRLQRSSHRSLTSPARATMPKPGKDTDKFGATRLGRESEKGDLSAVKAAYAEKPGDIDRPDYAGITPLQKAALHGHHQIVEYLISKGCRTDVQSDNRDTPLIDAVENNQLRVVKILLHKGKVNPHHQNKRGQRAIDLLDEEHEDFEEISKELRDAMVRESDTSVKESDNGPLQNNLASSLLYNEYNTETLRDKAAEGNSKLVEELLNSNIKPNIACGVAAARGGHDEILSVFLATGLNPDPDPSRHSNTYMLVAIGRGHLKVVELLLNQDAFDPTRKTREGLTYVQLAEERHGPKWEQEARLLRNAYDKAVAKKMKKSQSPKRERKQPPPPLKNSPPQETRGIKAARKSSPQPSDRSLSPVSTKVKRAERPTMSSDSTLGKRRSNTSTDFAQQPVVKRRKRVVSDDEDADSDDPGLKDTRPKKKIATKAQSLSDGEGKKIVKKKIPKDEDRLKAPKEAKRASSANGHPEHDSDLERRRKAKRAEKAKRLSGESSSVRKSSVAKVSSDAASESELRRKQKATKDPLQKIKMERQESPNSSPRSTARSTPVPLDDLFSSGDEARVPSRQATPLIREADLAEKRAIEEKAERQAKEAEAERQRAEAERKEEAERQRRAAEEKAEVERKKLEAEQEKEAAERKKEAERQQALEEERLRAIEEMKQKEAALAEERRVRRAEETAAREAREARLAELPLAVRVACEKGLNRPLHFDGELMGIGFGFLPIYVFPASDIDPDLSGPELWMLSHQAVGVLGLPEPDVSIVFPAWEKREVTDAQRDAFVHWSDTDKLAQEWQFLLPSHPDADPVAQQAQCNKTREQMRNMRPLHWIRFSDFEREVKEGTHIFPPAPSEDDRAPSANSNLPATPDSTQSARQFSQQLAARAKAEEVREMMRTDKFPLRTVKFPITTVFGEDGVPLRPTNPRPLFD